MLVCNAMTQSAAGALFRCTSCVRFNRSAVATVSVLALFLFTLSSATYNGRVDCVPDPDEPPLYDVEEWGPLGVVDEEIVEVDEQEEAQDEPDRGPHASCPTDYPTLERHDHEADHGDVCRHQSGNGAWACPAGCMPTKGGPPYCLVSTKPCRAPPDPNARPYRCDANGGERGVCVKAEGHAHYKGRGKFAQPDCDGQCGRVSGKFFCRSDWDCSLAGVCLCSGRCRCDPWATGTDCSYLNLQPVVRERLGYLDKAHTSWGGNAVLGADGQWHLFVAEIACVAPHRRRCGLSNWKTRSQVAHAIASHPDGPYVRQGLILPPMHHNPTVHTVPGADATWWLYTTSDWAGPIKVTSSRDQGQTWAKEMLVAPHQNPGPVLHRNGSMTLFHRRDDVELPGPTCSSEAIMAHRCAGPSHGCVEGGRPVFNHTGEDPSVFIDHRGNWHMLLNALPWMCVPKQQQGGHAWSRDGVTWSEPRVGAYTTTVEFTDGGSTTCDRRERPQMMLDPNGVPLALVTGVVGCPIQDVGSWYRGGDDAFTLVQRVRQ